MGVGKLMDNQADKTAENGTQTDQPEQEEAMDVLGTSEELKTSGVVEKKNEEPNADNFMELYEESLRSIQEGELVRGEIVQVNKEYVLVDIGYKSEGQIPLKEFLDDEGNVTAHVGEQVDVLLERREDDEGIIILSKEKASRIKVWDEVKNIYEEGGTIEGKITSRVKGGMSVDIGLTAFLPGSQIDLKPVRDFDSLIDSVHQFKIIKYNKRRSNIVLSRRSCGSSLSGP